MCYHRPVVAGAVLGASAAALWVAETHHLPVTTILGAVLAVELVSGLLTFLALILKIVAEHQPENIVEHGHHHYHEHPVRTPQEARPTWPLQAWEGTRERDRAA